MRAIFVVNALVAVGTGVLTVGREAVCTPAAYSKTKATRMDDSGGTRSKRIDNLSRHADWSLLFFDPFRIPREPRRVIKAIEIEWGVSDKVRFRSEDRRILEAVQVALRIPFRYAFPDDGSVSGIQGGGNIGTMWIITTDGKFMLGINQRGFALNARSADNHNSFFSWLLTKQLDELLVEHTGKHMPQIIFDGLSGEYKYKMEKKWWENHRVRGVRP